MTGRSWRVDDLLSVSGVASWKGDRSATVTGIAEDTRTLAPGDLFWGRRGGKADGNESAAAAFAAGASAVVVTDSAVYAGLRVPEGRAAALLLPTALLGQVASRFYGDPLLPAEGRRDHRHQRQDHHRLPARGHLEAAGEEAGLIGTVGYRIGARDMPATAPPRRPRTSSACWPRCARRRRLRR